MNTSASLRSIEGRLLVWFKMEELIKYTRDNLKKEGLPEVPTESPPLIVVQPTMMPHLQGLDRLELKVKMRESHQQIHQRIIDRQAAIVPRTQAHNRKCTYATVEKESAARADVVSAQIDAWRNLLPTLIGKFSRIPDPRRAASVKHQLIVLMLFGLFAFVLRLSSRREMNRELTGAVIHEHLKQLFPEITSIPHIDTLARLLKNINPERIEEVHIALIRSLIKKKKFKKLLINGALPISVDGTQRLYRNGLLQDERWCERIVGNPEEQHKQQYIYTIEANITLKNGLTIPLITEYLQRDHNQLM